MNHVQLNHDILVFCPYFFFVSFLLFGGNFFFVNMLMNFIPFVLKQCMRMCDADFVCVYVCMCVCVANSNINVINISIFVYCIIECWSANKHNLAVVSFSTIKATSFFGSSHNAKKAPKENNIIKKLWICKLNVFLLCFFFLVLA